MESFIQILDVLNKYSSLILVLATAIYVGFTIVLAKETRRLREVETEPFISLHLTSFYSGGKLKLIIKNIGKAPAYNITFLIDEKFDKYFHYNFKNKISYFPPNQELTIITDYFEEFDKSGSDNIPIKLSYYSKDKRLIIDDFKLEWKYLSGTLIGTDNIEGIKKSLEDINKEMKNLNKVIKDKKYVVSNKLRILEIDKNDLYVQFIFSNEYIGKVARKDISKLKLGDIDKVYIDDGDLYDKLLRLKFTAEEIYNQFKKIDKNI